MTHRRAPSRGGFAGAALAVLGALTAACQSPSVASDEPARLRDPDAACVQAVADAATQLSGRAVNLGAPPFTDGPRLWLESGMARDRDGRPLDGRNPGRPLLLTLSRTAAGACEVHHEAAGQRRVLPAACHCEGLGAGAR